MPPYDRRPRCNDHLLRNTRDAMLVGSVDHGRWPRRWLRRRNLSASSLIPTWATMSTMPSHGDVALAALRRRAVQAVGGDAHQRSSPFAGPFCDAVNAFYGRGDIPIGVVKNGKTPGDSKFLPLAEAKDDGQLRYPHKLLDGEAHPMPQHCCGKCSPPNRMGRWRCRSGSRQISRYWPLPATTSARCPARNSQRKK